MLLIKKFQKFRKESGSTYEDFLTSKFKKCAKMLNSLQNEFL